MTKEKERKMFVGVVWNCAAELKLLLTAILFLCSLITILQFMPSRFSFTSSNFSTCISTPITPSTAFIDSISPINATSIPPPPPPPSMEKDEVLKSGLLSGVLTHSVQLLTILYLCLLTEVDLTRLLLWV